MIKMLDGLSKEASGHIRQAHLPSSSPLLLWAFRYPTGIVRQGFSVYTPHLPICACDGFLIPALFPSDRVRTNGDKFNFGRSKSSKLEAG